MSIGAFNNAPSSFSLCLFPTGGRLPPACARFLMSARAQL